MAESTEADEARGGETVDGGGTAVVGFGVVFGVVEDNVFKARAQVNSGSGDGVLPRALVTSFMIVSIRMPCVGVVG